MTEIYDVIINIPEFKSINFTIATETDEYDHIVRIIVIVEDEHLCRSVDEYLKGSSCETKHIRPDAKPLSLSKADPLYENIMIIFTMTTLLIAGSYCSLL